MVESFGEMISRYLREEGMPEAELARRINKSKTYVNQLVRDLSTSSKTGKPKPSVEVVDSIAHILHIPIAQARLAAGYAPPRSQPETMEQFRQSQLYHLYEWYNSPDATDDDRKIFGEMIGFLESRLEKRKRA